MVITIREGEYHGFWSQTTCSGFKRLSPVNLLNGNMGIANAERALYLIRVLTEFISQPAYQNLIPIFGIMNEPLLGLIGRAQMTSFYLRAHDMIRNITGYGEGHGPVRKLIPVFLPAQMLDSVSCHS